MILDQGIGAHHAQTEYFGLGGAWTWVSGDSPESEAISDYAYLRATDQLRTVLRISDHPLTNLRITDTGDPHG